MSISAIHSESGASCTVEFHSDDTVLGLKTRICEELFAGTLRASTVALHIRHTQEGVGADADALSSSVLCSGDTVTITSLATDKERASRASAILDIYKAHGSVMVSDNDYASEESILKSCIALDPLLAEAYLQLASCLDFCQQTTLEDGRVMTSKELILRSISLQPTAEAFGRLSVFVRDGEEITLEDGTALSRQDILAAAGAFGTSDINLGGTSFRHTGAKRFSRNNGSKSKSKKSRPSNRRSGPAL